MFHFAYGSNLSKAGMSTLCPPAEAIGRAVLPDHRLLFRGYADVVPSPGATVPGGLWRITPACLAAFDLYEEVERGLYRRHRLPVRLPDGTSIEALVYRMTAGETAPPPSGYLATVRDGYRDFGLDRTGLDLALR